MPIDFSSFLSDGAQIPAGSALKATQTENIMPQFYTDYAQQILANQAAVAGQPYQTYQGPRVAEFAPAEQQGFALTGQAAGAYQPSLTKATTATEGAMNAPGAYNVAQPWLEKAGASTVANIGQYMNPYTENVVNRIGELGQRNLSEKLLPALTSKYISAGQLGFGPRGAVAPSSGMMTDTARALRDVNADVLAQQADALQKGYGEAAALSAADLSRYGTLGQYAGNLANTQITQQLAGAEQLASLGGLAQKYGLEGANAILNVGKMQRDQAQKNIDVAYENYLSQKGYNQEQIDKMIAAFKGVSAGIPTGSQEFGIVPSGQQEQPSTASTIAGTLTGLAALLGIGK